MMPFRIPQSYDELTVYRSDPVFDQLQEYVDWLRTELKLAELALQQASDKEASK